MLWRMYIHFSTEQDSLLESESLRVAGQHLYMNMLESPDHKHSTAALILNMLSNSAPQQNEALTARSMTHTVVLVDALYLAVGLGCEQLMLATKQQQQQQQPQH